MELKHLVTETRNPASMNLDRMSALEIVSLMNREDEKVITAVREILPKIASAVDLIVEALKKGGRLFYLGAGTSGRLGVLDASECQPTFGVGNNTIIGLIAGGDKAIRFSAEGAEDNESLAVTDLKAHSFTKEDILCGLAASGRTPYVIGGLKYARSLGAKTLAIACNKNSVIGQYADIALETSAGSEVLTGSTRLKAGTTQKLILNMLSTAAMVRCGKAYQNLMVDVVQSNEKLVARAENIVKEATNADIETIRKTLKAADGSCKLAIVMILGNCDKEEAATRLKKSEGKIREAIK